jgi:hypothetical protein
MLKISTYFSSITFGIMTTLIIKIYLVKKLLLTNFIIFTQFFSSFSSSLEKKLLKKEKNYV